MKLSARPNYTHITNHGLQLDKLQVTFQGLYALHFLYGA